MPTLPAFLWDIDPAQMLYGSTELHRVLGSWWHLPTHPTGRWFSGDWIGTDQYVDREDPRFRACFTIHDHWVPTLFPLRFHLGHRIYGVAATGLARSQAAAIHAQLTAYPTYLGMRPDTIWSRLFGREGGQVRSNVLAVPCWIHDEPWNPPDATCEPLRFYAEALESIAPVVAYHPDFSIDPNLWNAVWAEMTKP